MKARTQLQINKGRTRHVALCIIVIHMTYDAIHSEALDMDRAITRYCNTLIDGTGMVFPTQEIQAKELRFRYATTHTATLMEDWLATSPIITRHNVAHYAKPAKIEKIPRINWSAQRFVVVDDTDWDTVKTVAQETINMHSLPKGFRKSNGPWKPKQLKLEYNPMTGKRTAEEVKALIQSGARLIIVMDVRNAWHILLQTVKVNSAITLVDRATRDIIVMGHTNMPKKAEFDEQAAVINKVLYANKAWRTLQWRMTLSLQETWVHNWPKSMDAVPGYEIEYDKDALEDDVLLAPEAAQPSGLPRWAQSRRTNIRWARQEGYAKKGFISTKLSNVQVFRTEDELYSVDRQYVTTDYAYGAPTTSVHISVKPAQGNPPEPDINAWLDHEAAPAEDALFNRARLVRLTHYFEEMTKTYVHYHADQVWKRFEELGRLESIFGVIEDVGIEEDLDKLPEWLSEKRGAYTVDFTAGL